VRIVQWRIAVGDQREQNRILDCVVTSLKLGMLAARWLLEGSQVVMQPPCGANDNLSKQVLCGSTPPFGQFLCKIQ